MQGSRNEDAAAIQAIAEYETVMAEFRQVMTDLCDLRAENAGRPPVNLRALAARDVIKQQMAPLAAMHRKNGESRGVAVLDTMLHLGMEPVASAVGNDIVAIKPEFAVAGRGRVDRAVEHQSGRLSIIEVKDSGSPREVVAGIGQVLFYKAMLERSSSWDPIVPMLAVLHERDEDIARACSLAGVTYLPLGDVAWLRLISKILAVAVFDETV